MLAAPRTADHRLAVPPSLGVLSRVSPLSLPTRDEGLQLGDRVVDGERGGFLTRWELPERLEELGRDGGRVEHDEVVVGRPLAAMRSMLGVR